MINFYNQVPSVYTNTSRDFQYLSWLINIVLNSVKHNVDDLYDLPDVKADPRLTEILALTLGFKVRRNYDHKQLTALVSIIPYILKHKGTTKAITMAGEALIKASGSTGVFKCEMKNNLLEVMLPKDLIDTTLFIDLLPYILPAGMTYRIIRKTQIQTDFATEFKYQDIPIAIWQDDLKWQNESQTSKGLVGLFNVASADNQNEPIFANYTKNKQLNAGLLDNTVIPVLANPMKDTKLIKQENEE